MDFNKVWSEAINNSRHWFDCLLVVNTEDKQCLFQSHDLEGLYSILVRILLDRIDWLMGEGSEYDYEGDEDAQAALEELYNKLLNMFRHKDFNINEIKKYFGDRFDSRLYDGLWSEGIVIIIIDFASDKMIRF